MQIVNDDTVHNGLCRSYIRQVRVNNGWPLDSCKPETPIMRPYRSNLIQRKNIAAPQTIRLRKKFWVNSRNAAVSVSRPQFSGDAGNRACSYNPKVILVIAQYVEHQV